MSECICGGDSVNPRLPRLDIICPKCDGETGDRKPQFGNAKGQIQIADDFDTDRIADLERGVVDAAVNWKDGMNLQDETHNTIESCEAQIEFDRAVDALLREREGKQ